MAALFNKSRFATGTQVNYRAIRSIYRFEMARTGRTLMQSVASPVLSTSLYFVVFGSAIGSRITSVEGVSYGAFIVPGLIMLSLLTQSISNASFGIYFPKFVGTIYEVHSAPLSYIEIVAGYVGAAATKSVIVGLIILGTARVFVDYSIAHPLVMVGFLLLTAITFSLFGFIIGIWADNFEKLQVIPLLIITPLTFLGGSFYSVNMLSPLWQKVTLFNPVLYLISGFRWSFYGLADVGVGISLAATFGFLALCVIAVWWIFKTGYKLKVSATMLPDYRRTAPPEFPPAAAPACQGPRAAAGSRRSPSARQWPAPTTRNDRTGRARPGPRRGCRRLSNSPRSTRSRCRAGAPGRFPPHTGSSSRSRR